MNNDNREIYRKFSENEKELPLFSRAWWLDAVTQKDGGVWNAAIKYKNGKIAGVLPYVIKDKHIIPPHLTPRQGHYIIFPEGQKYQTRIHHEVEILTALINDLPNYSYFSQFFFYQALNWQPFYWAGFKATPRYSYIIKAGTSENELIQGFHTNLRNSLKKASEVLDVVESDDIKIIYDLVNAVFQRKKLKNRISYEFFVTLDKACKANNASKILAAYDKQGNLHAAEYFVWDDSFVYALSGGSDPKFRNSQAVSLLHKEGILLALRSNRGFDFEGTMLQEVESQFRQFGAVQTMYLHIMKDNRSILTRSMDYLRRHLRVR